MTEIILRHDDIEASLPHQIEPPAEWGMALPDPLPFTVSLPKWCPVDKDSLVELHWWASLCVHLHALIRMTEGQEKVRYRLDKALREELTLLRNLFGGSVSAAIAAAGALGLAAVPKEKDELREVACWTMAVQVSFGLLTTRAAAKGMTDATVAGLTVVSEWIAHAFKERMGDEQAHRMLMTMSTGVAYTAGIPEALGAKLESWRAALAQAAEGAPEGVPGVAEAVEAIVDRGSTCDRGLEYPHLDMVAEDHEVGENRRWVDGRPVLTRQELKDLGWTIGPNGQIVTPRTLACQIEKGTDVTVDGFSSEADLTPGTDQTGVSESTERADES